MIKHFFIIDNDEDELFLFIDAIKALNIPYSCTWAKTGEQAIKQLSYVTPDIIFIDYNMPCMNGLEYIKAIRGIPLYTAIPIVLHPCEINDIVRSMALEFGATICINKIDVQSLQDIWLSVYAGTYNDIRM
jgi:CheY-like chemotaxis protein